MAKRFVPETEINYFARAWPAMLSAVWTIGQTRCRMQFRFPDKTLVVNMPSQTAVLDEVTARFRSGRGFALATINLDHLVKLRQSASYRRAYAAHDLIVADGNPVVWLSRLAGMPVSLVPGSDLLRPLLRRAAMDSMPVAFFGSQPEVLDLAAQRLRTEIPGLDVAWTRSPPMGFDPLSAAAEQAIRDMQAAGVRLCIVSLTAPRQETFAARGHALAPEIGFCCFGAGLDFVAGRQVRAPRWVRAMAMEWLWRAASAPRRLVPRYAACAAILPGLAFQALRQRRG